MLRTQDDILSNCIPANSQRPNKTLQHMSKHYLQGGPLNQVKQNMLIELKGCDTVRKFIVKSPAFMIYTLKGLAFYELEMNPMYTGHYFKNASPLQLDR